jgi:NAD(P)-dependent dehydrogenase (short-subunit alcohol dehydrogenase family)
MNGWTANDMPDQSGRVIIVTGANSGVGYESALALARKGARVVMACRSLDKAERARQDILKAVPGGAVDVLQLDLGSLKSVRVFADTFNTRHERLDVLMNNAGIMALPYGRTVDGFESQFGTNHLGHFALTGLLLPRLLATPQSRVVTVSSGVYMWGHINFDDLQSEQRYGRQSAYSQSKLANILFAQELQRKLEAARADTISVVTHPGYAVTNLQNHSVNRVEWAWTRIGNRLMGQPAELGATYQLHAATAPGVQGGAFYGPKRWLSGEVVRVGLTARGRDTATAARLWEVSEQLTGVRYEGLGEPAVVMA